MNICEEFLDEILLDKGDSDDCEEKRDFPYIGDKEDAAEF